ncbi:hypothetical protein L0U85_03735 [Glycomyces sp. L485]|uniref:hypothetical protein n=1 Tax=Glycomyces sp. L485 TaxID=2909235 RepID=UPI001F4B3305|nr:hypothetical protein [Glycomyces sp. L485]MCH7229973.1 hypothetical protein [Glycomyces sp. L485]
MEFNSTGPAMRQLTPVSRARPHHHAEPGRERSRERLIAIEGPTGAGKTTLAKYLASFENNTYPLRLLGGDDTTATRFVNCRSSRCAPLCSATRSPFTGVVA